MGKYCAVPMCFNSDVTVNPKYYRKLFFSLPKDLALREKWVEAIGRNTLPSKYNVFICEDHFDIKNDMLCYEMYKRIGGRIPKVKPDVVPHKFDCQQKEKIGGNKSFVELDKFKRRLIRAVARLLLKEKQPEEEIWIKLRKETGCDCRLLWSRMRALTVKKLNRLLVADDNVDAIPKVARMSLTDWLLFDLVLVHQKMDLLGLDTRDPKDDPVALHDLFNLVKMFKIEGLRGDNLAKAWSSATLYYNIQGHQCSPMLLQRRWYLLKELTRSRFYDFWNSYRGALKRLPLAEPFKPSPLQAAIAKQYKCLVVKPFMEWEELIENRLVILPEEFEQKMLERQGEILPEKRKSWDNAPDLEVIEPVIETIDLRLDSDNENEGKNEDHAPEETEVKIKEEPQEMDIDIDEQYFVPEKKSTYDEVLESTTREYEKIDNIDDEETQTLDEENGILLSDVERTLQTEEELPSCLPQITSVFGNVVETDSILGNPNLNRILNNVDDTNFMGKIDENSVIGNINESIVDNLDENIVNDNVPVINGNLSKIKNLVASLTSNTVTDLVTMDQDTETNEYRITPVISPFSIEGIKDNNVSPAAEVSNPSKQALCKPIEIDIESDVENNSFIEFSDNKPINTNENAIKPEDSMHIKPEMDIKPDIDSLSFGVLSNDINFVDDGIELVDDGIAYQDEDCYVGDVKTEVESEENDIEETEGDVPKIDAKLLMCPIIYTTRLDDMGLFQTQPFDHVNDKNMLDIITSKSKPIKDEQKEVVVQNDMSHVDDCSEDEISESQKVKVSSYLLQKPRSRSYNTIQLCKNPDFNTRLKRLTVGFFSSMRNRALFKACKPLTIDLSKAFESKLVAGTLYLKVTDNNATPETIEDTESSQNASVVPSAMPVQCLIDNSKISDILPLYRSDFASPKLQDDLSSSSERNKVINLPDISEIRRINQRLLTAEVTPIQVQNNMTRVPVSIVASSTPTFSSQEISFTENEKEAPSFSKCPPKVVDITEERLSNTMRMGNPSASNCNRGNFNQMGRFLGRPPKQGKNVGPAKPAILPWRPRPNRPEITWLSRNQQTTPVVRKIEEHLLTLDTLHKMLYLLSDKDAAVHQMEKPKPKSKKKKKDAQQLQQKSTRSSTDDNCALRVTSEPVPKSNEPNKKCCKPKINIKSANYYSRGQTEITPENDRKQNDNVHDNVQPKGSRDIKKGEIQYCCWAREKMLQMLCSKKNIGHAHECAYPVCTCCCRTLLNQFTINEKKLKHAEAKGTSIDIDDESIEDTIRSVENVDKDSENSAVVNDNNPIPGLTETSTNTLVLHQTVIDIPVETPIEKLSETSMDVETPVEILEAPDENIVESSEKSEINVEVANEQVFDDLNKDGDIPVLGSEICIATTQDVQDDTLNVESTARVNQVPAINIKIVPTIEKRRTTKRSVVTSRPIPYHMLVESASASVKIINPTENQCTTPSTLTQLLVHKKAGELQSPKTYMVAPKQPKPLTAPKLFKEKMIYLNSKTLSEKPSDNPIFLGKNKILLTTIKFPSNLRKFEEAKQVLKPTLNLPNGIELVCLPNGTVAYHQDPNAEVSAADLATLPAIIAAVQQQINLKVSVTQQSLPVTENEIVDLIDDDDDDSTSKVTKNNNKNLSVATEQRTDVDHSSIKEITPEDSFSSEKDGIDSDQTTEVNYSAVEEATPNVSSLSESDEVAIEPTTEVNNSAMKEMTPEDSSSNEKDGIDSEQTTEVNDSTIKEATPDNSSYSKSDEVATEVNKTMADDSSYSERDVIASDQTTEVNQSINKDRRPEDSSHSETDERCTNLNDQNNTNSSTDMQIENRLNNSADQNTVNDIQENVKELSSSCSNKESTSLLKEQNLPETSSQNTNFEGSISENTGIEHSSRNKSKNILSDLMEMSGIFEEDITTTLQETLPPRPDNYTPPIISSLEDVSSLQQTVVHQHTSTVYDKPIDVNNVPSVVNSPIGELFPITSLYELKYACQNNGVFFKLDFDTGYLVPINVCMKQHQKPTPPKKIDQKSVIDLTDDDDVVSNRSLLIANQGTSTGATTAKPVKLFKSLHPGIIRRLNQKTYSFSPSKKLKVHKLVKSNENTVDPATEETSIQLIVSQAASEHGPLRMECQFRNGKPKSDLVDAGIDIAVADRLNSQLSDTNSINNLHKQKRKQYLKNSKSVEKTMFQIKVTKSNINEAKKQPAVKTLPLEAESEKFPATIYETDDSSDDEPLAKKAKRKRANDSTCPEVPRDIPIQRMDEDVEKYVHDSEDMQINDDDGMQVTHYELLLDQSDGDNEEEEHCILGV